MDGWDWKSLLKEHRSVVLIIPAQMETTDATQITRLRDIGRTEKIQKWRIFKHRATLCHMLLWFQSVISMRWPWTMSKNYVIWNMQSCSEYSVKIQLYSWAIQSLRGWSPSQSWRLCNFLALEFYWYKASVIVSWENTCHV